MPRLNLPRVHYANGDNYRTMWDKVLWIKDRHGRFRWVDKTKKDMLLQWAPFTIVPQSSMSCPQYKEPTDAEKKDLEALTGVVTREDEESDSEEDEEDENEEEEEKVQNEEENAPKRIKV